MDVCEAEKQYAEYLERHGSTFAFTKADFFAVLAEKEKVKAAAEKAAAKVLKMEEVGKNGNV